MKNLLLVFFLFLSSILFSQEYNVGGSLGTNHQFKMWDIRATFELELNDGTISLNADPGLSIFDRELAFIIPIYGKLISGQKIRICPTMGFFQRIYLTNSDREYGWTAGLMFEKPDTKNNLYFLKFDLAANFERNNYSTPGGHHYNATRRDMFYWFHLGVKKCIVIDQNSNN